MEPGQDAIILFKRTQELTDAEDRQVQEVARLSFTGDGGEGPGIEWSESDWVVLAKANGQVVSLVELLVREITVGEHRLRVCGLGGVATHPDWRRRGLAGRLLERSAQFMREELAVPFGMLVCSEQLTRYYHTFGWQRQEAPLVIEVNGEKREVTWPWMVLFLSGDNWPKGVVDLNGKPW